MMLKLCVDHCGSLGYAWAATEYGQEASVSPFPRYPPAHTQITNHNVGVLI